MLQNILKKKNHFFNKLVISFALAVAYFHFQFNIYFEGKKEIGLYIIYQGLKGKEN